MYDLPPEIHTALKAELRTGERLIWAAQPDGKDMAKKSWPIVLFGIPWTAFSLLWIGMAIYIPNFAGGGNAPKDPVFSVLGICFPLFGLPFVLIGFGMLSTPYWINYGAKRSVYAITNQRAIIRKSTWRSIEVRSFTPNELTNIIRTERSNQVGDLVFQEMDRTYRDSDGHLVHRLTQVGFMSVPQVVEVEGLLHKHLLSQPRGHEVENRD